MRLKQLAYAVLCSGALIAPALAQSNTPPKPTVPMTTTPGAPSATGTGTTSSTAPTTTTTSSSAKSTTTTTPVAATPQTGLTNINTASAADLDKLPLIGKVRAANIIKGRPYTTTDDLLTKKVLTKGVFDKIKAKITA